MSCRARGVSVFVVACLLMLAGPVAFAAKKEAPSPEQKTDIPVFQPPPGIYTNAVSVTIRAAPNAIIYYTTNGSMPGTNSLVCTSAVSVSGCLRLRARAFQPGLPPSRVMGGAYTLVDSNVSRFTSPLPIVLINTFGEAIVAEAKKVAYLAVMETNKDGRAGFAGPIQHQGRADLRLRGSSSLGYPKHAFGVQLVEETIDAEQKAALVGMPADSDYVLYASYPDKTLMRNAIIMGLWEEMGHYSVRCRHVEVFRSDHSGGLITTNDYYGVYVLMEKIKQGKHRVNVTKMSKSDTNLPAITGGYILKKDRVSEKESPFNTSMGHTLGFVYPKGTEVAPQQKAWINGWFNEFEKVLYGPGYTHSVTGYCRYIDVPSFIDHYWIVEMPKTIDGYVLSMFMHKDREDKLVLSPIWDRDFSIGNADYMEGDKTSGWFWSQLGGGDLWYRRLFTDPDFNQKHIDRWAGLRSGLCSTTNLMQRIDRYAALLEEPQKREFARWPRLGVYVWPNSPVDRTNTTYAGTVQFMKGYLKTRLEWIDSQLPAAPVCTPAAGTVALNTLVTLASGTNAVYYTLDGSDPRQPGGAPAPNACLFTNALKITSNTLFTVRSREAGGWSAPVPVRYTVK